MKLPWLIFRFILMFGCFSIAGYISYSIVMYGVTYVDVSMTNAKLAKHFLIIVEVGLITIWYINKVTTSTKVKNTFSFNIKKFKVVLPTISTVVYYFLISALFVTSVIPATLGVEQNRKEKIHWYPDEVDPINTIEYEKLIEKNKELITEKEKEIIEKKKEIRSAIDEKVYSRAYWSKYRKEKEIQEAQNNIKEYTKDIATEVERFKNEKIKYKRELQLYKEQRKNYFTFIIKNFWESIVIIILQLFNLYTSSKGSKILEGIIDDIKKLTKDKKKNSVKKSTKETKNEEEDELLDEPDSLDEDQEIEEPKSNDLDLLKNELSDLRKDLDFQLDIPKKEPIVLKSENDLNVLDNSENNWKGLKNIEETHDDLNKQYSNIKVKDAMLDSNKTYLGKVNINDLETEEDSHNEEKETIITERELMDDSIPIRPPGYAQRRKIKNTQN